MGPLVRNRGSIASSIASPTSTSRNACMTGSAWWELMIASDRGAAELTLPCTSSLTRYHGTNAANARATAPSADIDRPYRERSPAMMLATSGTNYVGLTEVEDHARMSSECTQSLASASQRRWASGS